MLDFLKQYLNFSGNTFITYLKILLIFRDELLNKNPRS